MTDATGRLHKRGDTWQLVIRHAGKTERRASGLRLDQEEEAKRLLEGVLAELNRAGSASGLTVEAWGEKWAAGRLARKVVSADIELSQMRHHVFPQLGALPLSSLTTGTMLDWVRSLPARVSIRSEETLAPRTVLHIAGTVKRMLGEAVDRGLLADNPCRWRSKRDLPAKRDKVLGKRNHSGFASWEVHALVTDEAIPLDRRVLWAFDYLTGMRPGEVAARRWRDLDTTAAPLWRLDVGTAYNSRHYVEKSTKTNVEKVVPIHPLLAELLRLWHSEGWAKFIGRDPTPDDLIVPRERGTPRTNSHSNKRFQADLVRLGLRGGRTHYETRATFRSLAIGGGAPREALDLITHPSPKQASDLYTRMDQVWPAMCAAVLAVKVVPRAAGESDPEGADTSSHTSACSPFDPEKEKARRLVGLGPISGQPSRVGAVGLEPTTLAV